MSNRKEYLRLRRETLVALSAAQRSEVAYHGERLQQSLRWVDRVVAIARAAPLVPAFVAAAALVLLRAPRHQRLLWSGRLITGWKLLRLLRARTAGG